MMKKLMTLFLLCAFVPAAFALPDGTLMVIRYELSSGAQVFKKESLGQRCPAVGAR
jgi:hypothetical protein